MVQEKLAEALRQIVGDRWTGVELKVGGTRRRWDMGFTHEHKRVVVEFDGDEHYRHTMKIKVDREKDAAALAEGLRVVRVPYWVQLDRPTFRHLFGFDADIETDFPHGFITTKVFPASFCELGVDRFKRELSAMPPGTQAAVVASLRDRAREHGAEYVVPTALLDLLHEGPLNA